MTTNTYQIGDMVAVQGVFTDANDVAFDPDVVTVKYLDPSGNATSSNSPTKVTTGTYTYNVPVDESGVWHYRFEGETSGGEPQGADEKVFEVEHSNF